MTKPTSITSLPAVAGFLLLASMSLLSACTQTTQVNTDSYDEQPTMTQEEQANSSKDDTESDQALLDDLNSSDTSVDVEIENIESE